MVSWWATHSLRDWLVNNYSIPLLNMNFTFPLTQVIIIRRLETSSWKKTENNFRFRKLSLKDTTKIRNGSCHLSNSIRTVRTMFIPKFDQSGQLVTCIYFFYQNNYLLLLTTKLHVHPRLNHLVNKSIWLVQTTLIIFMLNRHLISQMPRESF